MTPTLQFSLFVRKLVHKYISYTKWGKLRGSCIFCSFFGQDILAGQQRENVFTVCYCQLTESSPNVRQG